MLNSQTKILQKTFLYYVSVLAFSFLILRINWMLTVPIMTEAILSLAVLIFFVSRKSVNEYLSKIPAIHLRLFLVFFFLLSSAHFIDKGKTTFPFLTWGMYSSEYDKPQIIYYDYMGVKRDGQKVRIIPQSLFPVIKHSRLNEKLEYLLEIYERPETNTPEQPQAKPQGLQKISHLVSFLFKGETFTRTEALETIDALVLALGREYNLRHKTEPILAIEIIVNKQDLKLQPETEATKQVIRSVMIGKE